SVVCRVGQGRGTAARQICRVNESYRRQKRKMPTIHGTVLRRNTYLASGNDMKPGEIAAGAGANVNSSSIFAIWANQGISAIFLVSWNSRYERPGCGRPSQFV